MSEDWKTKEILENCLKYITEPREVRMNTKVVQLWPHVRGYDCGPCELGLQGRCGRLPCMYGEGIPYGLPFINWQTTPHTALIADLKNQLGIDVKDTIQVDIPIQPI